MPQAAGYSGTPLAKKLGFRAHFRCYTNEAERDYLARFDDLPAVSFLSRPKAPLDLVHLFVNNANDLETLLRRFRPMIEPAGMIWVSWPKKASKIPTDITEDTIRELAFPLDLVDVKVCAVDAIWSGLKLVIRVALRKSNGMPNKVAD